MHLIKNNTLMAISGVILASILWGTTGTAASFAPSVNALAVGAFSMGIGGLLLCITAWRDLRKNSDSIRKYIHYVIIGGLCVAIYPLVFYSAMKWSGIAVGTVVSIASAPFFSALLERLINKQTVSVRWMISFIIGTLGILLLVSDKQDNNAHSTELYHWGIVLGLIAGLTYATYSWVGKTMIQKNISSKASMASMFGFAAIFLLPSLYFTGGQVLHSPMNIAVLLYVALIPMFLGYLMFGYALNHIAASQATLITLLEPAVATILAIVIVGERFSILGGIGLMAIFCCLFVQLVPSRSEFIIKKIDTLE